jgi:hypothetical protein
VCSNLQVFPSDVAKAAHDPFLSIEDHEQWLSPTGIRFFLEWASSHGDLEAYDVSLVEAGIGSEGLGDVPLSRLKSYRECVCVESYIHIGQLTRCTGRS